MVRSRFTIKPLLREDRVKPFDAPSGTVWRYKLHQHDDVYVVLDKYSFDVPGEHSGTEFRMCLDLLEGEIVWMSEDSHYNNESKQIL